MRISSALLGAALMLGACDPGALQGAPDRAAVSVAGETITIAAPPGFCVDPASTSVTGRGAFLLVSDCGLLGFRADERAASGEILGAVMTASVSANELLIAEGSDTTLDDLEAFALTARGRAVLGRSGEAEATRTLQTLMRGDVLYVLVEDRGAQPMPGVEPRFWRAFLNVSGRMTALSAQGFAGAGVGPEAGLRYLIGFAESIKAANRG